MRSFGVVGRTCVMAVACTLVMLAAEAATGQESRVLLIRPLNAMAVPPDALRTFQQAVLDAAPDVTLVPTIAEATDLVELTRYAWSPDEEYGVSQTWQFHFLALDQPQNLPMGHARPGGFVFIVGGKTLAESTQASVERLRDALRKLLSRFPRVLLK
jgi:hypothetical protein